MKPIIAFVAFCLAMGALMLVAGGPTSRAAAQSQKPPAPIAGTDLLYVQTDHVYETPQGAAKHRRATEFWLDTTTGDARFHEKDLAGTYEVIYVRSGRTYTRYFPLEKRALTQIAADDRAPFLTAVQDMMLGYKAKLAQGEVRAAGRQAVDGKAAVKVERRGLPAAVSAVDAYLDEASGLPLREVGYRLSSAGQIEQVETHQLTHKRDERLPRSQVPANHFAVATPAGWASTTARYLTPATAASFRQYDLYWLGPSYGGLPLFGITHDEVVRPAGPPPSRSSGVAVLYAHPFSDGRRQPGDLSVVQGPPPSAETPVGRPRPPRPGNAEQVTVGGRQATLYSAGRGHVQVELTIGGTFITVHGAERGQVLQAAQSLRRLN